MRLTIFCFLNNLASGPSLLSKAYSDINRIVIFSNQQIFNREVMTNETPFIFWPLLFIQILLFYKKSAGPAEAEENLNSRSSPRAAISRARSRHEETDGENFVHHFLGETSDYTGDYRIIRKSS